MRNFLTILFCLLIIFSSGQKVLGVIASSYQNSTPYIPTLAFSIDNSSGSFAANSIYIDATAIFPVIIDWGDGTITNYSGANNYTMNHTYASSSIFNVKIKVVDTALVKTLYLNYPGTPTEKITNLTSVALFTNLYELNLRNCSIANIDAIAISNSISNLETDALTFNRSLPTSLTSFNDSYSGITSFTATNYPSTIITFYAISDNLTTSDVNAILIGLDGAVSGAITVNLSGQGTPAPPSGAGITAKNSLIAKGGTITTD